MQDRNGLSGVKGSYFASGELWVCSCSNCRVVVCPGANHGVVLTKLNALENFVSSSLEVCHLKCQVPTLLVVLMVTVLLTTTVSLC